MDTIAIKEIFIIGIWFIYKNGCFSNYGEKKKLLQKSATKTTTILRFGILQKFEHHAKIPRFPCRNREFLD